jgi:Na+-driven multidrug efflux pump
VSQISSQRAVFTSGSILRHVMVMTATASVGLMAIFIVDFLSLLYVSWLGRPAATAGVGFATIILFFATSINIGLMIAVSALVSRALGAGKRDEARRIAGSSIMLSILISSAATVLIWPFIPAILTLLGASGEARDVAVRFLHIALPSNVLMATGMALSGVLRAVGDAKRAMFVTLTGGLVTAVLDPFFIFGGSILATPGTPMAGIITAIAPYGFGLGPEGAALVTVISRLVFALIGARGAIMIHNMVAFPSAIAVARDWKPVMAIAGPAVLTNLATPLANAFVMRVMADFGDKAVAAVAIIDRLVPVAFGVLFALSGAVGPILGQNWGAGRHDRMRRTLSDSLKFAAAYVCITSVILFFWRNDIVMLFNATDQTADIIRFFCLVAGPMWLALGGLFVANAAFNNLGFPLYSTAFNWGRATLGTIPLAWLGGRFYGPEGVLVGMAVGGGIFGIAAIIMAYRAVYRLEQKDKSAVIARSSATL